MAGSTGFEAEHKQVGYDTSQGFPSRNKTSQSQSIPDLFSTMLGLTMIDKMKTDNRWVEQKLQLFPMNLCWRMLLHRLRPPPNFETQLGSPY